VAKKALTRSITNKRIAGVCGGLGEHIDADPVVVRLLWVVLSLGLPPAGIFGYIIAWIIIPKAQPLLMAVYPGAAPVVATPPA
jgi:phage shock protein PspC (stress-responsive transcriptional regulator)